MTVVVRVLTKYVKGFESFSKDRVLQHIPRCAIPKGYVTEQFPLCATTIEEATVHGNLLFHDDIYVTQLRWLIEELSKYAIPSINDQLTNSWIHSGQSLCSRDSTACRECHGLRSRAVTGVGAGSVWKSG